MATFSKRLLSDSTSGRGIVITQTATAGNDLHTAVAGSSDIDEIWLYATNIHTSAVSLTIEWGGVTVARDTITVTVPSKSGLMLVAPGLLLNGGIDVAAFASVASKINIFGYVNRITA